jgi:competence CoiA-like predicted nuclease
MIIKAKLLVDIETELMPDDDENTPETLRYLVEEDLEKLESYIVNDVKILTKVDMNYLKDWYQDSIDQTQQPIWTDKHLEELTKDFNLFIKEK